MHTIVLATHKGGTGKSTLAIGLALAAIQAGHTVRLIETCSARHALQLARPAGRCRHPCRNPVCRGDFAQRLSSLEAEGVTLAIVDTAAGGAATSAAIRHADLCLIPARPSIADIEATASTLRELRAANAPFAFVLNQTPIRGQRVKQCVHRARRGRARYPRCRSPTLHRHAQRSPGRAARGSCGERICPRQQIRRRNPRPLAVDRAAAWSCRGDRRGGNRVQYRACLVPVVQTPAELARFIRKLIVTCRGRDHNLSDRAQPTRARHLPFFG